MTDEAPVGGPRASDGSPAPDGGPGAPPRSTFSGEPITSRTRDASPPPARAPRPFGWLVGDLGLKAVALVLALTTWVLVRDQVHEDRTIADVSVVLDGLPPSFRLNVAQLPHVAVSLGGAAGAVERARLALEQGGHRIRLRLNELGEGNDAPEGEMTISDPSKFTFPFPDARVVTSVTPPVHLAWYRIESLEVEVQKPQIGLGGRADLEVVGAQHSVEPARVTVTGPASEIAALRRSGAKITPDDVSPEKWLKTNPDFAMLFAWSSGFTAFREQGGALRSETLLTIAPPTVTGKTKIREAKLTEAEVDLALLYPAGLDARAYEKFDVKILDTTYDARTHRLRISVRGDPSLVTELTAGHGGWTLFVTLPQPPKDESTSVESVPATVVLLPPAGEASPRLRLVSPPKLFVTLDRRKGP